MTEGAGTREVAERFYRAVNAHRLQELDNLVAEDVALHGMSGEGLPALQAELGAFAEGFADYRLDLQDLIVEGDRAVGRSLCAGTHTGPFAGIPPTGRAVAAPEADFIRVSGGRIVEVWVVFDQLAMMRQLGLAGQETEEAEAPA